MLLYTVPFLSELADTMKDWVVTGICFLHAAGTSMSSVLAALGARSEGARDRLDTDDGSRKCGNGEPLVGC